MSTREILAELSRLTPAEREAVRSRLDDLDAAAPLTPDEQKFVAERVAVHRQNPGVGVSWAAAEGESRQQLDL